jgi:hypothetical protein
LVGINSHFKKGGFKLKTEVYTVIDYNELNSLARKLKPDFDFLADYEANNDSSYTFVVDDGDIASFNETGGLDYQWITVSDVLTALVINGDIPKGKILVEVSW